MVQKGLKIELLDQRLLFFVVLRSIVYCIVHIAQVATLPAYVALLQRVVEYVVTLLPVKIANGDASAALH